MIIFNNPLARTWVHCVFKPFALSFLVLLCSCAQKAPSATYYVFDNKQSALDVVQGAERLELLFNKNNRLYEVRFGKRNIWFPPERPGFDFLMRQHSAKPVRVSNIRPLATKSFQELGCMENKKAGAATKWITHNEIMIVAPERYKNCDASLVLSKSKNVLYEDLERRDIFHFFVVRLAP